MRSRVPAFCFALLLCFGFLATHAMAPSPGTSPAPQTGTATLNPPHDAIDDPVLEQADEEDIVPYMKSRVIFKYDRLGTDGGAFSIEAASIGFWLLVRRTARRLPSKPCRWFQRGFQPTQRQRLGRRQGRVPYDHRPHRKLWTCRRGGIRSPQR
jgi:hypothetical protein